MKFPWVKNNYVTIGIALLVGLTVTGISKSKLFFSLENKTQEYWFKFRGTLPSDPRIVLIDIDDDSIAQIGRWPWDRSIHAEMIQILSESGAEVIGYDILFNQKAGEKEDQALADAVKQAGNVILPVGFELEGDSKVGGLLTVKREVGPIPELGKAASGLGHISSFRDHDGIIRRIPLMVRFEDRAFPAFSLSMLARYLDFSMENLSFKVKEGILMNGSDQGEIRKIPTDQNGIMLINFTGKWVETFNHFSFIDVLKAWNTENGPRELKEILAGKICLVSNTAIGYDLKPIPLEKDFPGGGIHANVVHSLLTEQFLSEIGSWSRRFLIVGVSFLTAFLTMTMPWWLGLTFSFFLMLGVILSSFLSFQNGIVIQSVAPGLAVFLTYVLVLIIQYRITQIRTIRLSKEKEQIGSALLKLTDSLRDRETHLNENRRELSFLRYEIEKIRGKTSEKVERIKCLEKELEQATLDREAVSRKKRELEEKVADLLIEPVSKMGAEGGGDETQKECAHYGIVTCEPGMFKIFERAKKASKSPNPVLILGESGTGKELFAWAVHKMSARARMPFVTVNVPAIQDNLIESELFGHLRGAFTGATSDRKGLFQLADGGTIFLDEIGEMKLELQGKLLRVLQYGEVNRVGSSSSMKVDVRVIAATNRDLMAEVKKGTFREDLFYRLNVIPLTLPPLRDRLGDLEILIDYFIKKHGLELGKRFEGLTLKAMERLKAHPWPGNIRELENTIARGVAMASGNRVTETDLELGETDLLPSHPNHDAFQTEDDVIGGGPLSDSDFVAVLRKNKFEIGETSKQLNLSRNTVASRFKGICFKVLAQQNNDFVKAAELISGNHFLKDIVAQRIHEYYENLVHVIKVFEKSEEALQECRRRFKNVPKGYFSSLDILVRRYFDQTVTK